MNKRYGWLGLVGILFVAIPCGVVHAQTPDGETPASEGICASWGMTGKVQGLCNAYCEAMDCDAQDPQASDAACDRVFQKILAALGDADFPTCRDVDGDGVPNGIDNCPEHANYDQADEDGNGVGDVCEACSIAEAPLTTTHEGPSFGLVQITGDGTDVTFTASVDPGWEIIRADGYAGTAPVPTSRGNPAVGFFNHHSLPSSGATTETWSFDLASLGATCGTELQVAVRILIRRPDGTDPKQLWADGPVVYPSFGTSLTYTVCCDGASP